MAELARIYIDLSAGAVEVEAPVEAIEEVFSKLESFVPQLADGYNAVPGTRTGERGQEESLGDDTEPPEQNVEEKKNGSSKRSRSRGSTSRKETYATVDLGLDPSQRNAFRQFYEEKSPKTQNPQVLVIMYWLAQNADRTSLSRDEIYTAFRTVNAQVPRKISSVVGNLVTNGTVKNDGGGKYSLTHVGEDFVAYDLPQTKS